MIEFGSGKTLRRLDEMLDEAINGTFEESRYDETELSRLEAKWKQYLTSSKMSMEKTKQEKENVKALVSDISHQTKTPLANILLYAQLLEEQTKDKGEKELAEQIVRQTKKLEFLLQSLVKMSRLETEMLKVIPQKESVKKLIQRVLWEMEEKAQKKHISIVSRVEDDIQAVFDLKWTQEALGNVVDNAVKYSPENSRIVIEAKFWNFFVCISVSDEGIGIPEEERAQIFGRFYRGSRVTGQEGVGIGLYLTREILQREGGYIKVFCLKKGSRFELYLPTEREICQNC